MQNRIVLAGISVNLAIALSFSVFTWQLLRFRRKVAQWNCQLKTLEQELQQALTPASQSIRQGQQQLQQGRRQLRQLQVTIQSYRQLSRQLFIILQWKHWPTLWSRQTRSR